MLAEKRYERGELVILFTQTEREAKMIWRGASDARDPNAFLEPVFNKVMADLDERSLTIDFTDLEFMNSSTVSPIISLLKTLDARGIKSRVVFGAEDWQQVHLRCLRTITRVLKHVQVSGSTPPPSRAPRSGRTG